MPQLTLDELKVFLLRSVGDDESIDLSGDIQGTALSDLGFDSLAVIDTTSRLEQHFKIKFSDDDTSAIATPQDFLDIVNRQLAPSV